MNIILDYLGYFGPFLLFFFSIILIKKRTIVFNYYIIGYFFNIILNIFLKWIIKEPRPTESKELINILKNNNKYIHFDKYGMPSGHAELVFYSTFFIYILTNNIYYFIFCLIISFITIYQRVETKSHSVLQVFVGSIIGIIMAYLFFHFSEKKIKGILKHKKDDNVLVTEGFTH